MKGFFNVLPKKHFEWKEPEEFRQFVQQHELKESKYFKRMLRMSFIALLFWARWLVAIINRRPEHVPLSAGSAIVVCLCGGLAFEFGLPWLITRFPKYIRILDEEIFVSQGNQHRRCKFKSVISYSLWSREEFQILRIHALGIKKTLPERIFTIGIPNTIEAGKLQLFLESRGVRRDQTILLENAFPL